MSTLTFQIPDSQDRNLLLALLRRLGIAVADETVSVRNQPNSPTFFRNAKKHIAKAKKDVPTTLSTDIDQVLYGG